MTGLPRLEAGTGRFKDGVFDFCVSVRFNATEEQLQSIRAGFQAASGVLFDATDGQHSFGKITILNNSGGSDVAEYWVNEESGRAYATSGNYGVRGEHVMLYMPDNFAADDPQGNAYTIAHEHAHHSYGLYDEYKGWDDPTSATPTEVDAECAAPAAEGQNLSYCLMDNYFTRGGSYTLNEFCITGNHDPDRDTDQSQQRNGDGCWTTLSGHPTRSANAPAGTPVDAAAAAPMVEFATSQNVLGAGDLRVMLVIDRSGSMADERKIQFARTGAILFSLFVKDGQGLGLVQFNSTSQSLVPLQVVSPAVRSGVLGPAIRGITPSGGTDIGAGLERALVEFTANAAGGCSDIIVLLSDGDGTLNQSTIDKLKDAAVSVLAIGIGAGLSTTGQAKLQDVAKQTGGQYFRGINPSELIAFFLLSVMESRGNTPISRSPMNLGPNAAVSSEVMIEPGVESATFAVAADTDNGVTGLRLRSPSGQVITEASAGANGITVIVEEGSHSIEVENPEPGDWTVTTETGAAGSGEAELLVFAEHDGVRLSVTVAESEVDFPNPITVFATPRFDGAALLGAAISGVVEQPAGGRVPIALLDHGSPLNGDKLAGVVRNVRRRGHLYVQPHGVGTECAHTPRRTAVSGPNRNQR
jgi:Mg-chelatase subunit ChlD